MRIGLVIYGSLETRSGGYLYDRMLVEYLRQQGDQVEIISLPWRSYPRHLSDNLSTGLHQRLRGLNADILLQDELNHPSLIWVNRTLRMHQTAPIVSIVHHLRSSELRPSWQNRLYRQVERSYLESVDGFIFNSQTTRQAVTALTTGVEKPHIVAYPAASHLRPGVTASEAAARLLQPGPMRLLFVGNLIPRKGLHVLIQALAEHANLDWQLSVAGSDQVDPAYTRTIQRSTHQLGLAKRVQFLGALPQAALEDLFRTSHVLVVPSSYEGFGIVYLEAMGFGLPAIATTAGAAAEVIVPGYNGCLVPPENPSALSDVLCPWLGNRQMLVPLAQNALETYAHHPTWQQAGEIIRAFLMSR